VQLTHFFSPFKKFAVNYDVIPWVTFTDPEVAQVGLNETMAKERGIAYEVTRYGIDDLDRAIAEGEAHGFVKVLTVPGKDKVLGCTIVGPPGRRTHNRIYFCDETWFWNEQNFRHDSSLPYDDRGKQICSWGLEESACAGRTVEVCGDVSSSEKVKEKPA
jgi:hypothetical protein